MSRAPSDATKLRAARSEVTALMRDLVGLRTERDSYRARATKAEQEAAEWKERFDILLRREEPKP